LENDASGVVRQVTEALSFIRAKASSVGIRGTSLYMWYVYTDVSGTRDLADDHMSRSLWLVLEAAELELVFQPDQHKCGVLSSTLLFDRGLLSSSVARDPLLASYSYLHHALAKLGLIALRIDVCVSNKRGS
jgi:hypothetical protein